MVLLSICVSETKYSKHVVQFKIKKNESIKEFNVFCNFLKRLFNDAFKKLDFMAGDAPLIDEINILKSYCHTFDEVYVNDFAKEEIKGRYRLILGLEPEIVIINYDKVHNCSESKLIHEYLDLLTVI